MSAHVELDDHFKTTLALDVRNMLFGEYQGHGSHRAIFHHATHDDLIVKVENSARSFCNITEYHVWEAVKDIPAVARWLAPVVAISPNGQVLLMKRCEEATAASRLPSRVPAWLADLKAENWGFLDGRPVCFDYGHNWLIERAATARLKRAKWGRE